MELRFINRDQGTWHVLLFNDRVVADKKRAWSMLEMVMMPLVWFGPTSCARTRMSSTENWPPRCSSGILTSSHTYLVAGSTAAARQLTPRCGRCLAAGLGCPAEDGARSPLVERRGHRARAPGARMVMNQEARREVQM